MGFSRTTYRIARTYLASDIQLHIAHGGLELETPPPVPTEYVACNVATLVIGPRPRYSFFNGGAPDEEIAGRSSPEPQVQDRASAPVVVDSLGVLRWTANGEEVALFGVNYSTPFAYAYRAHGYLGVDRKQAIDSDVLHLSRLGLDAWRIHVWDREVSDRDGNLLENEHIDLLDYLLGRLAEHASFLFGLFWKKTPPMAASGAMLLGIPVYGLLLWSLPGVAFLHHMMITFFVLVLFMTAVTLLRPMTTPVVMPEAPPIELTPSRGARIGGWLVIAATVALYIVFW